MPRKWTVQLLNTQRLMRFNCNVIHFTSMRSSTWYVTSYHTTYLTKNCCKWRYRQNRMLILITLLQKKIHQCMLRVSDAKSLLDLSSIRSLIQKTEQYYKFSCLNIKLLALLHYFLINYAYNYLYGTEIICLVFGSIKKKKIF